RAHARRSSPFRIPLPLSPQLTGRNVESRTLGFVTLPGYERESSPVRVISCARIASLELCASKWRSLSPGQPDASRASRAPGAVRLSRESCCGRSTPVRSTASPLGSALISATNGKTTTAAMAAEILRGRVRLAHNRSGANLVSGVASTLLDARRAELGLFEVDEAALPEVAERVRPRAVCLGNLF